MTVAFYTLGCKLNQVESEALAASFKSQGFFVVKSAEANTADIVVVNTCTVTSKAEQKARRMVRKYLRENPELVVILTGCYAELEREELNELGDRVVVLSLDYKARLSDLAEYLQQNSIGRHDLHREIVSFLKSEEKSSLDKQERFRFDVPEFQFHTRAFMKIQDGCDNRCAYCRVPLARGNSVSLDLDEIVLRTENLLERGYKEIVLTGVNISAYEYKGKQLPALLEAILPLFTDQRLRLSSIEPDKIGDDFVTQFAHPNIMPHLHLPIQSGSNKILERMNRHYHRQKVIEVVKAIREVKGEIYLSGDIIVGFPGETDQDFQDSFDLLHEIQISDAHVFPYSPRPGTAAEKMRDLVPERVSRERASRLRDLAKEALVQYKLAQKGKTLNVLIEKCNENFCFGLTENYLRCKLPYGQQEGDIVSVFIENPDESF